MRVIVVGATGTVGNPVADALAAKGHEVLRCSRKAEHSVDMNNPESIRALYASVGQCDAVVCCAGDAAFKPLSDLSDDDLMSSIKSKLLGQVNLVRFGLRHMRDGGVFVLTSGIFSRNPLPGVSAVAMVNGAVESFVRGAALDAPRQIRINAVSPPFITETAQTMGMPTEGTLSAADNAQVYVRLVEGDETGQVVFSGD